MLYMMYVCEGTDPLTATEFSFQAKKVQRGDGQELLHAVDQKNVVTCQPLPLNKGQMKEHDLTTGSKAQSKT